MGDQGIVDPLINHGRLRVSAHLMPQIPSVVSATVSASGYSVGTEPSITAWRSGSGRASIACGSMSWAASRCRCRCDAPSVSMRCAGLPQPRSSSAIAAGSWFGPLNRMIVTSVVTASAVWTRHSSCSVAPALRFGAPFGLPDWPGFQAVRGLGLLTDDSVSPTFQRVAALSLTDI